VLFNEPKLLKFETTSTGVIARARFSALQRAEIAEIGTSIARIRNRDNGFSALQRAEIAEISACCDGCYCCTLGFSALQRAEIAEIVENS